MKLRFVRNIKLWIKLLVLLIVPILTSCYITFSAVGELRKNKKFIQELNDELFEAQTLLLDADKDMYQALTGQLLKKAANNDDEFEEGTKLVEKNIVDATERVEATKAIVFRYGEELINYKGEETGNDYEMILVMYDGNMAEWVKRLEKPIAAYNPSVDNEFFEVARDNLNDLCTMLGTYTDDKSKELSDETDTIVNLIIRDSIIALVSTLLISAVIIIDIKRRVRQLNEQLKKIAQLDLSGDKLDLGKDEIGSINQIVNMVISSFKETIFEVRNEVEQIKLQSEIAALSIASIEENMTDVSSVTQKLSKEIELSFHETRQMQQASTEMESAIEVVLQKAEDGETISNEIETRAETISAEAEQSTKTMESTQKDVVENISLAIEESKKVTEITNLAASVLKISSQTKMLAFNASIEAAKAGVEGKGFAAVAQEIRRLSEMIDKTVNEIQSVAQLVVTSVDSLRGSSKELTEFITSQVANDYEGMLQAGNQYKNDATLINNIVTTLGTTSEQLMASVEDIGNAVASLADSSSQANAGVSDIVNKIVSTTENTKKMTAETQLIKESVNKVFTSISKFQVES
ncbi:methyl-accepting chemotaxis protein [Anaerotignum sp. MB30-C6]|uniref:methyl-accepting chemotaxis protein n=1 Tax=Anaerotignum sp. MB30-C6 TaxID=3070814 RepID=UPI0027DB7A56|nr:methyl-accepting chemotaxis protein [Anaerotignum sp. MB30-C6]WMI80072.1 methyl-accepting chemotaxis protein [Anaerotignum sp. MB30-C6]